MVGLKFGDWMVLEEDKERSRYYICKCENCGKIKSVHGYSLRSGKSTSCGCTTGVGFKDETGKTYGMLKVIEYIPELKKYKCRCSCGEYTLANGSDLRNGSKKTCGNHKYIDLQGKIFGDWKVLSRADDNSWNCVCLACGTQRVVLGQNLRNGRSTSCGCNSGKKKAQSFHNTMKMKYGELSTKRIGDPREQWQLDIIENKDKFIELAEEYRINNGRKPDISEISQILNTSYPAIIKKIHMHGIECYFNIGSSSNQERELLEFIRTIYNGMIIQHDRSIVKGYEIDIYLPELKIAFEYNGNYWHSDDVVDKKYHLYKTDACDKLGIRLIHIFEYEWTNDLYKDKLKLFIKSLLNNDKTKIYARDCTVVIPTHNEVVEFTNRFHFQSHVNYSVSYALKYNGTIVSLMSFGVPRFNSEYSWELLRFVNDNSLNIVGGASKLLSAFIKEYKPDSIVSYCDKSKFNGKVYDALGFERVRSSDPNYVWVKGNEVIPRYRTTKKELLKQGIGSEDMSETEIMKSLHYMRVFDCGNYVYVWHL